MALNYLRFSIYICCSLTGFNDGRVWLGLTFTTLEIQLSNGTAANYMPESHHTCLAMNTDKDFEFHPVDCHRHLDFICEGV